MRIVAALGGNALLERGEAPDADIQETHVVSAVSSLAPLIREHEVVITHGNGPQVGVLALESARDPALSHPYPFDVLGAQTQGMIGYWIAQALSGAVPGRQAVCVICRTIVRADDPAMSHPAKFVGPVYDQATATRLAGERGWQIRRDGAAWRRVVPSPEPVRIVELDMIRLLAASGAVVICTGGGGVPVTLGNDGGLHGVEAVLDKDLTAALLAQATAADALLLLTDVPAVIDGYGTARARPISRATAAQLRGMRLPAGSMGPKVEAACRFAEATGRPAAIGRLDDAAALLAEAAGTVVTPLGCGNNSPEADGRVTATGHGAYWSIAWATEPRFMTSSRPRPREPTAISWACSVAASNASRGAPGWTRRITLTSGCSFSCVAIRSLKSSSSCREPPRMPGASARAQTASKGTLRSSASWKASVSAAREAGDPSVPATTGHAFSLG